MPRYFLHFAYKGTQYHGWQRQQNALSVQACVDKALSVALRTEINSTGQGRTDTGVHARSCYLHFDLDENIINEQVLIRSLNALLPADIAAFTLFEVPNEAHARFSASSRSYEYRMHVGKNPFLHGFSTELHALPNANLIEQAIPHLIGKKDFGCFAKVGSDNKTNICDLTQLSWENADNQLVLKITADRFLRNMVRAIAGTLLEVGYGKRSPHDLPALLALSERSQAGESVPAHGLYLVEVAYPDWVFALKHGQS